MSKVIANNLATRDGVADLEVKHLLVRDSAMENLGEYKQGIELKTIQQYFMKDGIKFTGKAFQLPLVLSGDWEEDSVFVETYGDQWDHDKLYNKDIPNAHDAAAIGFRQEGEGAVERSLADKSQEIISVRDYITTLVDGVTSNQDGIVAAVAAAKDLGADLEWPRGIYISDSNIPDFWSVRHVGKGRIKRGSVVFDISLFSSFARTIYVSPLGSEGNDGLTENNPMPNIQVALDALEKFGPVLLGQWKIKLSSGVYNEPAIKTGLRSVEWLVIEGPPVHGGEPTAIIDTIGKPTTYGLWFGDHMRVLTRDIKIANILGSSLCAGIVSDQGSQLYAINTHVENSDGNGINGNIKTRILVSGGKYKSCKRDGIRVYGNSTAFIGYNNERLVIEKCATGVEVSGSSYSHSDFIDFVDCDFGIIADYQSHSTNYNNNYIGGSIGWEPRNGSTINTRDVTYPPLPFIPFRSRFSFSGSLEGDNSRLYSVQSYESLGVNGRMAFGYSNWITPFAKFQYSKDGTVAGYNLSGFSPCTTLYESNANTIIGLASPDANFSAIWFGDSTNSRRSELRATGGNLYVASNNVTKYAFRNSDLIPFVDSSIALGSANFRWSQIYAGTGTINTSDIREKQQQRDLTEVERTVAQQLKSCLKAFKWNDAVSKKGDKSRWHFGVMAQEVAQVFADNGLDAHDYALFCYDEWEETPEIKEPVLDGDGNETGEFEVVQEYQSAGNRYGIRYDQLLAFMISAL